MTQSAARAYLALWDAWGRADASAIAELVDEWGDAGTAWNTPAASLGTLGDGYEVVSVLAEVREGGEGELLGFIKVQVIARGGEPVDLSFAEHVRVLDGRIVAISPVYLGLDSFGLD